MANYRTIATSETIPDAPVTSTLMIALAENPVAIAEGVSGAPKIAIYQQSSRAGSNSNLTFTSLGPYSGIIIHGKYASQSENRSVTISASTDGSSFFGSTTVVDASSSGGSSFTISLMFGDGNLQSVYMDGVVSERIDTTLSGSSDSIVSVRLSTTGDMQIAAMAIANGGRSAT